MQVTALRRTPFQVDAGKPSKSGFAVVYSASSGAVGWLAPLAAMNHEKLAALQETLYCGLPATAGLHPQSFRVTGLTGQHLLGSSKLYGKPPPRDSILDGHLLWAYAYAPRQEQKSLALTSGQSHTDVLGILARLAQSVTFY
jgi:hypothetical protein